MIHQQNARGGALMSTQVKNYVTVHVKGTVRLDENKTVTR